MLFPKKAQEVTLVIEVRGDGSYSGSVQGLRDCQAQSLDELIDKSKEMVAQHLRAQGEILDPERIHLILQRRRPGD